MRLDPRELADAIASAADPPIVSESTREELARALSRGEGVARDGSRTKYVVLQPPWNASSPTEIAFRPTLLRGQLPREANRRRFRTTQNVVETLMTEGAPGKRPSDKLHAPACPRGARVALAGIQLAEIEPLVVESHGRFVEWFNLRLIPVGSFVYRVREDLSVLLFQRASDDAWMMLELDGAQDIVNLPQVLHHVCSAHEGELEEPLPLPGHTVLLRYPLS